MCKSAQVLAYVVDIYGLVCHVFLDVKEEMHDVAVLDDIFLTFGGELAAALTALSLPSVTKSSYLMLPP